MAERVQKENDRLALCERLRRQAEEDPFGTLFGGRAARNAWYPWDWSKDSGRLSKESNTSSQAESQSTKSDEYASIIPTPREKEAGGERMKIVERMKLAERTKMGSQSAHDTEEYVYDPISMRKIPKSVQRDSKPSSDEPLSQKVYSLKEQTIPEKPSFSITNDTWSLTSKPTRKVESSLDRHLRKVAGADDEPSGEVNVKKPHTVRKAESSEDLDSLRADDIRAAFTKLKEDFSEREKTLQDRIDRRRQTMQEAFEKRVEEIEAQFAKETTVDATISKNERRFPSFLSPETQKEIEDQVREAETYHAREEQEKMNTLAAQMYRKQKANTKLTAEIEVQKAAMGSYETRRSQPLASDQTSSPVSLGEGDLSAQVLKYVASERWYKKKAPHALAGEREFLAKREEQRAKDRELIREMRDIYESAYGTIDTKHKQGPILETQRNDAKSGGAKPSIPQVDNSHPQLPVSTQSSVIAEKSEELLSNSDQTDSDQNRTAVLLGSIPSTSLPSFTPLEQRQKLENFMMLASKVEAEDWAILKLMKEIYQMAPQMAPPHFNRGRAFNILARYVVTAEKTQAGILALTMSGLDIKRLNTWHRVPHYRSHPERYFVQRRIIADILGPSREQVLEKRKAGLKSTEKVGQVLPLKSGKQVYKVLALNFDTHEVTSATTNSSLYESSTPPKSAASILSHLNYPASFIPHIEALQYSNFELVAGSRHMLVYKQISSEATQQANNETSLPIASDAAKNAPPSQGQSKKAEPTKNPSATEVAPAQVDKAAPQKSNSSSGSRIRITVNSPAGGTVKIPSISVSSSERSSVNPSSAAADHKKCEMASTSTTTQAADQAKAEAQQSDSVGQSSSTQEDKDDAYSKPYPSGRYPRENYAIPRRRRSRFWKRLKSLAGRSFLLGGLCYVAGCFSVWYEKRKEALEKAEKQWVSSPTPRGW